MPSGSTSTPASRARARHDCVSDATRSRHARLHCESRHIDDVGSCALMEKTQSIDGSARSSASGGSSSGDVAARRVACVVGVVVILERAACASDARHAGLRAAPADERRVASKTNKKGARELPVALPANDAKAFFATRGERRLLRVWDSRAECSPRCISTRWSFRAAQGLLRLADDDLSDNAIGIEGARARSRSTSTLEASLGERRDDGAVALGAALAAQSRDGQFALNGIARRAAASARASRPSRSPCSNSRLETICRRAARRSLARATVVRNGGARALLDARLRRCCSSRKATPARLTAS